MCSSRGAPVSLTAAQEVMDLVMISPIDRLDAVDIVGKYLSVETQGMTVKSDVSAGTWERRWSGGFKTDFTRFK